MKTRIARLERDTQVEEHEPSVLVVGFCSAKGQRLGPVIGLKSPPDGVRVDRLPGEPMEQLKKRFLDAWRATGPAPNCEALAMEIYPEEPVAEPCPPPIAGV